MISEEQNPTVSQELLDAEYDKLFQDNKNKKFQEYGYRWVILVVYVLATLAVSAMWVTCSPIAAQIEEVYPEINGLIVNLVTLSMPIIYTFMNFPSIYILDTYGLKIGMIIGVTFVIAGVWIRILINSSFVYVIIGQVLGGIGQPLLLNSPAKVATFWFNKKNRPVVTGILSLVNPFGVGLGFAFPAIFVSQKSSQDEMYNLMFWEAIIFSALSVPIYFLFKAKPPTPPSSGADTEKLHFKKSIGQLFKNKNFILIFISFSLVISNFSSIATLIGAFCVPFGYSNDQISVLGGLAVLFGLIGGTIGSIIIQKTEKYKLVTIVYAIIAFITSGALIGTMYLELFWVSVIMVILFGFFNVGMIPLYIDFACEVTFPMGEAMSQGCLITLSQLINVIQVLVVSVIFPTVDGVMEKPDVLYANFIGMGMILIAIILTFFLQEDLRRMQHEKKISFIQKQCKEDDNQEDYMVSNFTDDDGGENEHTKDQN